MRIKSHVNLAIAWGRYKYMRTGRINGSPFIDFLLWRALLLHCHVMNVRVPEPALKNDYRHHPPCISWPLDGSEGLFIQTPCYGYLFRTLNRLFGCLTRVPRPLLWVITTLNCQKPRVFPLLDMHCHFNQFETSVRNI